MLNQKALDYIFDVNTKIDAKLSRLNQKIDAKLSRHFCDMERVYGRKVRLMGRGPVSAGRVSQVISGHAACATVPRSPVRWLGEPATKTI